MRYIAAFHRLAGVQLQESSAADVELELDPILKLMRNQIDGWVASSQARHPKGDFRTFMRNGVEVTMDLSYHPEKAEKDKARAEALLKERGEHFVARIRSAISNIPTWRGSKVQVILRPTNMGFGDTFQNDEGEPPGSCEVKVFKTSPRNAASFTTFDMDMKEVDDVLDAGDSDFFRDPKIEADYFALVNELRNPGRASRDADRTVLLYTARPRKDRSRYEKARTIPSNVFLSTSFDEAEGYAVDFGDRDIWRVRIKKRYLILTLDRPRLQNYQTFDPSGRVPVEELTLM